MNTSTQTATAQDPRALLAKMEAERNAAQETAKKAEEEYETKSKELLQQLREADLLDVREKCNLHGFTATDLRNYLKVKGVRKTTPRKSAPRKAAAKKRTPKAK